MDIIKGYHGFQNIVKLSFRNLRLVILLLNKILELIIKNCVCLLEEAYQQKQKPVY